MVTEQMVYAFSWISWSGIIAGVMTSVALSILMAVLGVALGFTVIQPKSDEPASGLGAAFGIWSFVSVVVSMAGGGFAAGLCAGQKGAEHGFLVWAVVIIIAACWSSIALGAAVRAVGAAVRNIGSGAAGVASTMGKGAVHAVSGIVGELKENVDLSFDTDKLNENVVSVLRDTGIETLQPEYLQQQMREARSDLRAALHQLSLKPSEWDKIISAFLETEQRRLQELTHGIDKESAVEALMRTRNLPQSEAQTMVDNAMQAYEHAVQKVRESLHEAKSQVHDAEVYLKELSDQARDKADRMAATAAKTALLAAAGLVLAAVISMGAGACGAGTSGAWYTLQNTYIIK